MSVTKTGQRKLMNKEKSSDILDVIQANDKAFIKLIRDRLGIIIHRHQINDLRKTVESACHLFQCTPQQYIQLLRGCPDQSPILHHLIASITVGETYFFRDKGQMELLQQSLLPKLIERKRQQQNLVLTVWSAGCSSGEEIYTIAILLHEILPDIEDWTLNLLGTDINTEALQKAIIGQYSDWSMRSTEHYIKQKYFSYDEHSHYTLTDKIRRMVSFDYLNLSSDNYPSILNNTNAKDLILCRNVLIYFDSQCLAELMQKMSKSLMPGGYLLLGASDPVDIKATNLTFHYKQGVLFSRPLEEEAVNIPLQEEKTKKEALTGAFEPVKMKVLATPVKSTSASPIEKSVEQSSRKVDKELISKLLSEAKWKEVLETIHSYHSQVDSSAFLLNASAVALANLGKLEEAITLFQRSLSLDPTNQYGYFIYALTLTELNRFDQAEKALRKTLFFDHQFVAGHYHLGLLLLRNNQHEAGLKCLRNALNIAKNKDPNQLVVQSQALSYGRLVDRLGYEIELYSGLENTKIGNKGHGYKDTNKEQA